MTVEEAEKLELGLYRIYWVEGSSSLAAVGKDSSSKHWFVPCSWQASELSYEWHAIKRVDLLFSVADDRETKFNEAVDKRVIYSECDDRHNEVEEQLKAMDDKLGDVLEDFDTVDKKISNMNYRIEKLEHIEQPSSPVDTSTITDDETKILVQAHQIKLKYDIT